MQGGTDRAKEHSACCPRAKARNGVGRASACGQGQGVCRCHEDVYTKQECPVRHKRVSTQQVRKHRDASRGTEMQACVWAYGHPAWARSKAVREDEVAGGNNLPSTEA